jgi:hypothetical protein
MAHFMSPFLTSKIKSYKILLPSQLHICCLWQLPKCLGNSPQLGGKDAQKLFQTNGKAFKRSIKKKKKKAFACQVQA